MNVDVLVGSFLAAVVLIASHVVVYYCGRSSMVHQYEEREAAAAAAEAERKLHHANLLRERGRITDRHPDASGPPSSTHGMRVLGMRPEGRSHPPTRM